MTSYSPHAQRVRRFSYLNLLIVVSLLLLPMMRFAAPVSSAYADSGTAATSNQPSTVPILVTFKASASDADVASAVHTAGGTDARDLKQIHTHVINVPANAADQMVAAYSKQGSVAHAAVAVKMTRASLPNDPGYAQQWALPQIGWDRAYGSVNPSGSATIAVLDTGVDASQPDLAGRMVPGNTFVAGDPNTDPNGHGTEMAGITAASVDNNTGMAGVDYAGAGIMPVQVLQADGTGYDSDVVAGLLWAADNGANVALMAFSTPTYSAALADAVAYAESKGVVVVAATGNDGSSATTYPAGLPGVIGVAATDQNDNLIASSNTGSAVVAAPGVDIYTTQPAGAYGNVSGTSAAAAEVAGLAGLLVANGDSATQTDNQIVGATDPVPGQSFGRIDVAKALGTTAGPVATATAPDATPTAAAVPPVYSSNTLVPDGSIVIDGKLADWAPVSTVFSDPAKDIGNNGSGPSDVRKVWLANDTGNFYIRWDVQLAKQTSVISSVGFALVVGPNGSTPTKRAVVSFGGGANPSITYTVQSWSSATNAWVTDATQPSGIQAAQTCTLTPSPCFSGSNASVEAKFPFAALGLTPGATIGVWTTTLSSGAVTSAVADRAPDAGTSFYQVDTGTGGITPEGTGPIVDISKVPSASTVSAGGTVTYTITLKNVGTPTDPNNPSTGNATITAIGDTLQAGQNNNSTFGYAGNIQTTGGLTETTSATTGATNLTFNTGNFVLPSGQSATLSFTAKAPATADTYYDDATVNATYIPNNNAIDTGPVAPVTVLSGTSTTPTQLSVAPATGPYNGTTTLTATLLTTANAAVSGQTITFSLNGGTVGTATTNSSGVATLSNVSLVQNGSPIPVGSYPGAVTAGFAGTTAAPQYGGSNASNSLTVTQATPALTWTNPADITYGMLLSSTQLNATANVPGTFVYSPAAGTPLDAGLNQTLSVSFTPADTADYTTATASVSINVNKADQTISFGALSDKLDNSPPFTVSATGGASGNPVTFSSSTTSVCTVSGSTVTITGVGTCTITASQAGNSNYNAAPDVSQSFQVNPSQQSTTLTVAAASGTYGGTVDLSATLKAGTAPVGGETVVFSLNGSPACGGILQPLCPTTNATTGVATLSGVSLAGINAGAYQTGVSASFAGDSSYVGSSGSNTLTVNKATPAITWNTPAGITYGTALSSTQLDATSDVPGTFSYTPDTGAIPSAGNQTLSVTLTPNDTTDYNTATASVTLNVTQASVSFTLADLTQTYDGTAKSVSVTSDPGNVAPTITYSQNGNPVTNPTNAGSYDVTVTSNDPNYSGTQSGTLVINQATPTLTWVDPAAITYGTALSDTQLDATADVPGSFTYTPAAGKVLGVGTHDLKVDFTPTDTANYTTASKTVSITVLQAEVTFTLSNLTQTYDGTPRSVTVTVSPSTVPYSVTYTGTNGTTYATSTTAPTDAGSYTVTVSSSDPNYTGSQTDTLTVKKATPILAWTAPGAITYGTALSSTQLDATASFGGSPLPGSFSYNPDTGSVLNAGSGQKLSAAFTPTDNANFNTGTVTTTIDVNQAAVSFTLGDLTQTYDGSAKSVTVTADPSGVKYTVTYSQNGTPVTNPTNAGSYDVTVTSSNPNYTGSQKGTLVINQADPGLSWSDPAAITYGTALSGTQLDATAAVSGTFSYTPDTGSVLGAGSHTLSVTLTPDNSNYLTVTKTVTLEVDQATPVITWNNPAAITYGTVLDSTQLDATVNVPGNFVYSPDAGAKPNAGTQTLSVSFTPADTTDYTTASASVTLTVNKADQRISFGPLSDKTYGDLPITLSATGGASGNPVTFSSSTTSVCKVLGSTVTILAAGTCTINADQTGNSNYNAAPTVSHSFTVARATPVLSWGTPAAISYGTALSSTQLDATAAFNGSALAGTFTYTPASGTVLNAGTGQTLSATFTPTDVTDFTTGTITTKIDVGQATPTINWSNPADISYGTALSGKQLNATVSAAGSGIAPAGTFTYTPAAGTVLPVGSSQTLSVTWTPTPGTASAANYTTASKSVTINVTPATLTITAPSATVQYSDQLPDLTNVSYSGFVNGENSGSLNGTLNCTSSVTVYGSNQVGSGPGSYPVTCSGLTSHNYTINWTNGTLTVTPEDAGVTFTGQEYASTGSSSATTATVTLRATVQDATALSSSDPRYDPYAGNITHATLTFVNRATGSPVSSACTNLPVTLLSSTDQTTGMASCSWTASSGTLSTQYTIGMVVSGYYTRNSSGDDAIVTVSQLVTSMLTGGGYIVNQASAGKLAGAPGLKTNFGFNAKTQKKGVYQGNVNIIVRSGGHVYQIKSNSITSIGSSIPASGTCSSSAPCTGTFTGGANVQDVTNPSQPVSVMGGGTIQVNLHDYGEPGSSDTVGVTVYDKSGALYYSSNWTGARTAEQVLNGGNLVVH